MTTVVEIPFQSTPQTVSVTLAGTAYRVRLYWLVAAQCWVLDIGDRFGNPLIGGAPLVTGCDLLEQFGYLGIGGQLLVISDHKPPDAVPGYDDLGITGHVYFVPDAQ